MSRMPDPLDFNEIAVRVLVDLDTLTDDTDTRQAMAIVAEQLRLAWNARGAADIAKVEAAFEGPQPSMKTLDHALRSLDR